MQTNSDGSITHIRIHAVLHGSTANGPGMRSVVWTQGCSIRCPGCFNPETHALGEGELLDINELALRIFEAGTDGLTLTGGEPTDQLPEVHQLCEQYRKICDRSIILYTGRTIDEIVQLPQGNALLNVIDVAITGRFVADLREETQQWGSSNQTLLMLSKRLLPGSFTNRHTELFIQQDGTIIITGFPADNDVIRADEFC